MCRQIQVYSYHKNMKYLYVGFSKTGTKTIATAFRILGFEVNDIEETLLYHHHQWIKFLDRNTDVATRKKLLYEMYKNVDIVTDLPAYFFWELILEVFPQCKLIFHERPLEKWLPALIKTQTDFRNYQYSYPDFIAKPLNRIFCPTLYFIGQSCFEMEKLYNGHVGFGMDWKGNRNVNDLTEFSRHYLRHNAHVKMNAPKDKLLILENFEDFNWEKICKFVGKEVPVDVPFPYENKGDSEVTKIVEQLCIKNGKKDAGASMVEVIKSELRTRVMVFTGLLMVGFVVKVSYFQ